MKADTIFAPRGPYWLNKGGKGSIRLMVVFFTKEYDGSGLVLVIWRKAWRLTFRSFFKSNYRVGVSIGYFPSTGFRWFSLFHGLGRTTW